MILSSLAVGSLMISENGMGIFSSNGKSPLASKENEANLELCLRLTQRPGQNPRPAINSPSALLELWFDPMVAPAATFDCPISKEAHKKELLWCCS